MVRGLNVQPEIIHQYHNQRLNLKFPMVVKKDNKRFVILSSLGNLLTNEKSQKSS